MGWKNCWKHKYILAWEKHGYFLVLEPFDKKSSAKKRIKELYTKEFFVKRKYTLYLLKSTIYKKKFKSYEDKLNYMQGHEPQSYLTRGKYNVLKRYTNGIYKGN